MCLQSSFLKNRNSGLRFLLNVPLFFEIVGPEAFHGKRKVSERWNIYALVDTTVSGMSTAASCSVTLPHGRIRPPSPSLSSQTPSLSFPRCPPYERTAGTSASPLPQPSGTPLNTFPRRECVSERHPLCWPAPHMLFLRERR